MNGITIETVIKSMNVGKGEVLDARIAFEDAGRMSSRSTDQLSAFESVLAKIREAPKERWYFEQAYIQNISEERFKAVSRYGLFECEKNDSGEMATVSVFRTTIGGISVGISSTRFRTYFWDVDYDLSDAKHEGVVWKDHPLAYLLVVSDGKNKIYYGKEYCFRPAPEDTRISQAFQNLCTLVLGKEPDYAHVYVKNEMLYLEELKRTREEERKRRQQAARDVISKMEE